MAKVAKKKQPWEIAGVSKSKYYRDKKAEAKPKRLRAGLTMTKGWKAVGPLLPIGKKPPAKSARKRRTAAVPNGGASTASPGSAGEAWAEAALKLQDMKEVMMRQAADEALVTEFLARTSPSFWGGALPDRFSLTLGTLAALRRKLTDDGDTKG